MSTVPRVMSRTQRKLNDAKQKKLDLLKQQQLNEKEIKTQQIFSDLESIINGDPEFLKNLEDFVNDIKQDMVDSTVESLVVTTVENNVENNEEIFEDVSESEDRVESSITVEITDGPINDEECDENVSIHNDNVFSTDGKTATQQMIDRLNLEQDYIRHDVKLNHKEKCAYKIKHNDKHIYIENHDTGKRHDYGLITTDKETNDSSVVQDWEKFGQKNAKRRQYDFKGKDIEGVISMIRDILS